MVIVVEEGMERGMTSGYGELWEHNARDKNSRVEVYLLQRAVSRKYGGYPLRPWWNVLNPYLSAVRRPTKILKSAW